jgi:membrane-bound metal-dependent hydrolase YbcI (DUF457 family)
LNTPSHLIINAAIYKKAARKEIQKIAFLLGSFLPDIPLGLLSIGSFFYFRFLGQDVESFMPRVFDDLFFNNPWWIASHNFLHSPLLLLIFLAILWRHRHKVGTRGHWWLWFVIGCIIHTIFDILTHSTDGPLLFWPLDWHTRFRSPVSYYDPAYFGAQFAIFELGLDIVLLGYLFLPKLRKRFWNN